MKHPNFVLPEGENETTFSWVIYMVFAFSVMLKLLSVVTASWFVTLALGLIIGYLAWWLMLAIYESH